MEESRAAGSGMEIGTEEAIETMRKNYTVPEVAVRGVIKLYEPILSRDKEITELHYDFSKLTSNELIACLDTDPAFDNGKTLSNKQARSLFAKACAKTERDYSKLDEVDIATRISVRDMIACVRVGRSFFAHALAGAVLSTSKM